MSWSSTSKGAGMEDDKSSSTSSSSSTLPLEKRLVDFKTESGLSSKISGIVSIGQMGFIGGMVLKLLTC